MKRSVFSMLFAASALAAPPQPQPAASNTREEKPLAERIADNGGSLLRAQMEMRVPDALADQPAQLEPGLGTLRESSPFAVPEPKAKLLRKHDLVTVIIREESAFKAAGKSDIKREAEMKALLNQFFKLSPDAGSLVNSIGTVKPEIDVSGSRNFKGDAKVDRTDSLTARVQAEILDVKPNGTLVLQSRTRVKVDDEDRVLIISGTARADDVSPDNSILSSQLSDLNIDQTHRGAVRDGTKRGLLHRLLDGLNPF